MNIVMCDYTQIQLMMIVGSSLSVVTCSRKHVRSV
jgi:hypothetical protein